MNLVLQLFTGNASKVEIVVDIFLRGFAIVWNVDLLAVLNSIYMRSDLVPVYVLCNDRLGVIVLYIPLGERELSRCYVHMMVMKSERLDLYVAFDMFFL